MSQQPEQQSKEAGDRACRCGDASTCRLLALPRKVLLLLHLDLHQGGEQCESESKGSRGGGACTRPMPAG